MSTPKCEVSPCKRDAYFRVMRRPEATLDPQPTTDEPLVNALNTCNYCLVEAIDELGGLVLVERLDRKWSAIKTLILRGYRARQKQEEAHRNG